MIRVLLRKTKKLNTVSTGKYGAKLLQNEAVQTSLEKGVCRLGGRAQGTVCRLYDTVGWPTVLHLWS